jgi:PAS domain S-box-containing protein
MVGTLGVVSKSDAIKTERETESGECRERQRRDCSAVLDDILQSLPIGIYLVDAELRIIEANAIAARTFGFAGDHRGTPLGLVVRSSWPDSAAEELLEQCRDTLETGEPFDSTEHGDILGDRPAAGHFAWQIRRIALTDGTAGVVLSFRDVSEQLATARALEAERAQIQLKIERVDLVESVTGIGIFDFHLSEASASISPEWRRVYGLPADAPAPSFEQWLDLVHPEDRPRIAAAARTDTASKAPYYREYRVVWPDQSVHWVAAAGKTICDGDSRPVRLFGTVMDISARKEAERRSAESEERFRVALLIAPISMYSIDTELRCTWVYNPTFGFTSRAVIGKRDDELMPAHEAAPLLEFKRRVLDTGTGERRVQALTINGVSRTHDITLEPQRDADGRIIGLIGASMDITDLANAKAAAEAASKAKDQLLAVLSHELRTPLTPVLAASILMERDERLAPEHRAMMTTIRRNVELETRLIDDLLDITRIAKGKLTLHTAIVDAHQSIARVIDMCRAEAEDKGVRVITEDGARSHHVNVDPARFQQIIWNLLKNSIKFTGAGGEVKVSTVNASADRLHIRFRDTGIGIAADTLPHIFDAFEQGGTQVTQQFGGLGLGLAISKALAHMHDGDIVASSGGIGAGACFELALPTATRDATLSEVEPVPTASRLNLRILLAEDHADTRHVIEFALTELECTVVPAKSVAEALAAASRGRFDLLISDIGLPDGSGAALMKELKSRHGMRGIALSGFGRDEDLARSRQAGFDVHLVKPVSLDLLEQTLRRLAVKDCGHTAVQ